jgi:phosphate uptake regulator
MKRKLIQLSPSTAVVSLPSQWVKRNRLRKGIELDVEENENRIIISTQAKKSERETSIDVSKLSGKLMWLTIDAAYTAGYDRITIMTKDQEQTAYMTKVVRYFPGFIIEEERKRSVVLRDMAEQGMELDKILSRVFNLNIGLLEDAVEAAKAGDWETLKSIKRRDYTINSYIALCLRHINKFGYSPFSRTGSMHSYIRTLETLSDNLCELCADIGRTHEGRKMIEQALTLYRLIPKLHFSFSQEQLLQFDTAREAAGKIGDMFSDVEERELTLHA